MWMFYTSHNLGFDFKASYEVRLIGKIRPNHFDGHISLYRMLKRLVHHAKTARTDQFS